MAGKTSNLPDAAGPGATPGSKGGLHFMHDLGFPSQSKTALPIPDPPRGGTPVTLQSPLYDNFSAAITHANVSVNLDNPLNSTVVPSLSPLTVDTPANPLSDSGKLDGSIKNALQSTGNPKGTLLDV